MNNQPEGTNEQSVKLGGFCELDGDPIPNGVVVCMFDEEYKCDHGSWKPTGRPCRDED